MSIRRFLALALLVATSLAASGQSATQPAQTPRENVIFKKTLDSGASVSVVKGPLQKLPELKELLPNQDKYDISGLYTISVQLTVPGAETITIGSRIFPHYTGQSTGDIEILDCMVEPRRFIFVSAEGADLIVWEVRIIGLSIQWAGLHAGKWSDLPDVRGIAHTQVKAKLSRMAENPERIQVEITDARAAPSPPRITTFQQAEGEWKFLLRRSRLKHWSFPDPSPCHPVNSHVKFAYIGPIETLVIFGPSPLSRCHAPRPASRQIDTSTLPPRRGRVAVVALRAPASAIAAARGCAQVVSAVWILAQAPATGVAKMATKIVAAGESLDQIHRRHTKHQHREPAWNDRLPDSIGDYSAHIVGI